MRAANHVSVSQDSFWDRHCFHVTTLHTSMMARPTMAAATELMPYAPPTTHMATVMPSATAVIFSSRERGPSFCSSCLAIVGASGVSFTCERHGGGTGGHAPARHRKGSAPCLSTQDAIGARAARPACSRSAARASPWAGRGRRG